MGAMAFRNELDALRYRVAEDEQTLAELRARIEECDAVLEERLRAEQTAVAGRYAELRATHDPDIVTLRVWHDKFVPIAVGCLLMGVVTSAVPGSPVGPWGGIGVTLLGAFVLQLRSQRTVINRTTRRFDVRWPWSPRAYATSRPIAAERIVVRRHVRRSKGTTEITFSVDVGEVEIAHCMNDAQAERIAQEVRDFLSVGTAEVTSSAH
jgi:hypothetical protein